MYNSTHKSEMNPQRISDHRFHREIWTLHSAEASSIRRRGKESRIWRRTRLPCLASVDCLSRRHARNSSSSVGSVLSTGLSTPGTQTPNGIGSQEAEGFRSGPVSVSELKRKRKGYSQAARPPGSIRSSAPALSSSLSQSSPARRPRQHRRRPSTAGACSSPSSR